MPSNEQVKAAQELRLRFLYAIYDREETGQRHSQVPDVMRDLGYDDEDWDLFRRVTEPLVAEGMITGPHAWQHGLIRVSLTAQGRRLVEDKVVGADRADSPASIGDVKVEGSGNVIQVAQQSPSAQFAAQVHYESHDLRKIGGWADDVERRVEWHGLQPEDEKQVRALVEELKVELAGPEPDHPRLQRIGRHVLSILINTAGSLASAGLIETGQHLFGG